MKIREFNTYQAAAEFKRDIERLGWTCSTITRSANGYEWIVSTNYPL